MSYDRKIKRRRRHVSPIRIQVLAPPIILAGSLIWNLSPKVRGKREKHVRPKIQIIIPPPVVGVLIWNLYPKLGKIRQKRVYTKAGKPQVLAPPIAIAGSLIYTLRPKVYDKKDRRKGQAYRGRIIVPIHSGAAAVITRLIGEPFTPSDAVDAAAFVLSEITGAPYTAVDGIDGMPA